MTGSPSSEARGRSGTAWIDPSGAAHVRIWAHPGSAREGIEGVDRFRKALVIRVRERAVEGEANDAILRLISERFPKCSISMESGGRSRLKTISIRPWNADTEALILMLLSK